MSHAPLGFRAVGAGLFAVSLLATACAGPRSAPGGGGSGALDASARAVAPHSHGRPMDPWVFRSVLDGNARMLTAALDPDLWVAFDVDHGELWRVWGGDVHLTGTVYDTLHGPQPTARGVDHFAWPDWTPPGPGVVPNPPGDGWRFATGEGARLRWLGHRFLEAEEDGRAGVQLAWNLSREGRADVEIRLRPEARREGAGLVLQLSVELTGLAEGEVLLFDLPPATETLKGMRYGGGVRPVGSTERPRGLHLSGRGGRVKALLASPETAVPSEDQGVAR